MGTAHAAASPWWWMRARIRARRRTWLARGKARPAPRFQPVRRTEEGGADDIDREDERRRTMADALIDERADEEE